MPMVASVVGSAKQWIAGTCREGNARELGVEDPVLRSQVSATRAKNRSQWSKWGSSGMHIYMRREKTGNQNLSFRRGDERRREENSC